MGAGPPSWRRVPPFLPLSQEFLWDALSGTVWPLRHPCPLPAAIPLCRNLLSILGVQGYSPQAQRKGFFDLAQVGLVGVRPEPHGCTSLGTASMSCHPPPNIKRNGGLLFILPTESNFQVREFSDLKRFYCPARWKAAQVTPLAQSRVRGECSPVVSCRLWFGAGSWEVASGPGDLESMQGSL